MNTSGIAPASTRTANPSAASDEENPRKLVSDAVNVYASPGRSNVLSTWSVVDPADAVRCARNSVRLRAGSVPLSDHAMLVHARPPLPVDVVASIARSEHAPTDAAPTYCATGVRGSSGGPSGAVVAFAVGQHEQSAATHLARSTPPRLVTLSPGAHVAR